MYSLTNKDIDRVALSIAMIRQPSARRPESGYKCQDQGLVLQVFFRKNEICNKGKDCCRWNRRRLHNIVRLVKREAPASGSVRI